MPFYTLLLSQWISRLVSFLFPIFAANLTNIEKGYRVSHENTDNKWTEYKFVG